MVFQDKKNDGSKAKRKGASYHESAVTILTPSCHFNGKLYCKGSSRIGGKIEGEIVSEGLLIIEEEAIINAKIRAEEVIIQGQIKGSLEALRRVILTESSHFQGDISTPSLVIKEGAQFNGSTTMLLPVVKNEHIPVIDKLLRRTGIDKKDYTPAPDIQVQAK